MKYVDFSNVDSVGWIYIAANERMPDDVKVGRSYRLPQIRMSELNGTGVPGTTVLVYAAMVPHPEQVEDAVHEKLSKHKVPSRTSNEWFSVSAEKAYKALQEVDPDIWRELDPEGLAESCNVPLDSSDPLEPPGRSWADCNEARRREWDDAKWQLENGGIREESRRRDEAYWEEKIEDGNKSVTKTAPDPNVAEPQRRTNKGGLPKWVVEMINERKQAKKCEIAAEKDAKPGGAQSRTF